MTAIKQTTKLHKPYDKGGGSMFLGMSGSVWIIILACVVIAFLYAMADGRMFSGKKGGTTGGHYRALALCTVIAVAATVISKLEKYVGAPMVALIIGIVCVNCIPQQWMSASFKSGTAYVGKKYLSLGIVCLGATLSVTDIFGAAFALPLVVFNMLLAFLISNVIGRGVLHVTRNTSTLVGGGTCVCGGTAIAALSPVVKATEEETAYAMTAIFLFDLLACLSYPYLALYLGFDEAQFGFLAGTAINDTSSVVAAQETFAALKGLENYALPATIKVVRTSMIIVLTIIFSLLSMDRSGVHRGESSVGKTVWKALPKFILFFLCTVILNTILSNTVAQEAFYQQVFQPFFANGYKFFVTLALAGVGFKIKFRDLFVNGMRPIALGGCTWLALFLSSFFFATYFADRFIG